MARLIQGDAFSGLRTCTLDLSLMELAVLTRRFERLEKVNPLLKDGFPYSLRSLHVYYRLAKRSGQRVARAYPERLIMLAGSIEYVTSSNTDVKKNRRQIDPLVLPVVEVPSVKNFELDVITQVTSGDFTPCIQSFSNLTTLRLHDIQKRWSLSRSDEMWETHWGLSLRGFALRLETLLSIRLELLTYDDIFPATDKVADRYCNEPIQIECCINSYKMPVISRFQEDIDGLVALVDSIEQRRSGLGLPQDEWLSFFCKSHDVLKVVDYKYKRRDP